MTCHMVKGKGYMTLSTTVENTFCQHSLRICYLIFFSNLAIEELYLNKVMVIYNECTANIF